MLYELQEPDFMFHARKYSRGPRKEYLSKFFVAKIKKTFSHHVIKLFYGLCICQQKK